MRYAVSIAAVEREHKRAVSLVRPPCELERREGQQGCADRDPHFAIVRPSTEPVERRRSGADGSNVGQTYRMSFGTAAFLVGFALLWFAGIVGFIIVPDLAKQDFGTGPIVVLGLLLLGLALLPAAAWAFLPYKITLHEDGVAEFTSLARRVQIRANDVREIEWDEGDITIRHGRGKIKIVADRTFEGFLLRLFELNPTIKADGEIRRTLGLSPD